MAEVKSDDLVLYSGDFDSCLSYVAETALEPAHFEDYISLDESEEVELYLNNRTYLP